MKTLFTGLILLCLSITSRSQNLFHEDFENPDSVISSGSIGFAQCTRIAAGGNACDSSSYGVGDSCYLTTIPFSTVGQSTVILSFDQISKIQFFDNARVEVSNDNGITWITLTCIGSVYLGGSTIFCVASYKFTEASYASTWQYNNLVPPDNSWWKHETFDISALVANSPNVVIRFKLQDSNASGMDGRTGWYLDNINLGTSYLTASQYVSYTSTNCGVPQLATFYSYFYAVGYVPTDSLLVNMNFGDGSDTTYYLSPGILTDSLTHYYANAGGYNAILTVTDINGYSVYDSTAFLVVGGSGCSTITGKVYVDMNSNCIDDAGDHPLTYAALTLDSGGVVYSYAVTNSSGDYVFNIPDTGSYDIILKTFPLNAMNLCLATDTIHVNTLPSSNNDYAITCGPDFDAVVNGALWGMRVGVAPVNIYAMVANNYCHIESGYLKVLLDNKLNFVSAIPPGYVLSGDTVIWTNVTFPSTWGNYRIEALKKPTVVLGDTICITYIAETRPGDLNPSNNLQTICRVVSNSYDPNFKEVNPPNEIDTNSTLNYTIHFQNTGTDTAFKIIITDTLDSNLDLSTLTINGGSHNFSTNVYPNNLLVFTFNPIQLPDSGHNQIESNGFVSYSIKLKSGTAVGTHIRNNSYIFFDTNQPVITNTTDNVIVIPNAINELTTENQISVFPNPTSGNVMIKSIKPIDKIKVLNLLGEMVYTSHGNLKNEITVPIFNLSKGVYTLIIESENKIMAKKVLKM